MLNRLGILKPKAFVIWLVTYRCNLKCSYCEASSGENSLNELSYDEAMIMIDDLKKSGVKRLLISGGEPLVRNDIFKLLEYIDEADISLGFISNGLLVESNWNKLKKYKYYFFQTSFDGIPIYHDQMRGEKGSFEKAMKSIELFASIKTPVRIINSVVHTGNIDQLDEMLELVKSSKATRWQLTPLAKVGRAFDGELCLDNDGILRVLEFIKKNNKILPVDLSESHAYLSCLNGSALGYSFFCGAGLTRCSIMPDGEVLGCNQVYDNKYSEGNIKDRSFADLWRNEFKIFRKKNFRKECETCKFLKQCQGGCWSEWCTRGTCYKFNLDIKNN